MEAKKKAAKGNVGQKSPVSKVWLCKSFMPRAERVEEREGRTGKGWRNDGGLGLLWEGFHFGMIVSNAPMIYRYAPVRHLRRLDIRGVEVGVWIL
jgi:hypothetical protein